MLKKSLLNNFSLWYSNSNKYSKLLMAIVFFSYIPNVSHVSCTRTPYLSHRTWNFSSNFTIQNEIQLHVRNYRPIVPYSLYCFLLYIYIFFFSFFLFQRQSCLLNSRIFFAQRFCNSFCLLSSFSDFIWNVCSRLEE